MAENTEFKVVVGADITDIKAKMAELSKIMAQLANNGETSSKKIGVSFKQLASSISSIGSTISAALTAPLALLGVSLFKTTAEIQQISTSFEVFTGSATTAKNMLQEFKNIAINSPLQFQDITKGAQTLLGYGLTANQVVPITKMLGDISGGNADKFGRLALAFGQVNAAGRLMGQETRQMINAGFNPLQAISEKTGESMASLTNRMKDGQISVNEVAQAFIYATSEGGRFYEMADKQAQTLGGMWNKVKESFSLALAEIGDAISKNPAIKQFFTDLTDLITNLKDKFLSLKPETQAMIVKFLAIAALSGPILLFVGSLISGLASLKPIIISVSVAIAGLTLASGGLILLVGALATAFGFLVKELIDIKDYQIAITDGIKAYNKEVDNLLNKQKDFKFGSISQQIQDVEKNIRELEKALPVLQIMKPGDVKQAKDRIASLNKELKNLQRIQNENLGFSTKPTGGDKTKKAKAEKVEIIPGTDFILKEEGNKIKQLIQLNNDAANDIDSIYETSLEKRLEKLTQSFEKQKGLYNKYGLDFKNIQLKYLIEYAELKSAIEDKKISMLTGLMNDSIAKFKNANPFKPLSESTQFKFAIDKIAIENEINSIDEYASSIYSAFENFNISLASGFAEMAGTALSGGFTVENAFKSLGAMFLNVVGDLLIQIGTSAIKLGVGKLAIEAALTAFGGAGIAAGIAAVTAGTALKSLAGKVSDSMSNTSTSASTSVSSASSAYKGITSGGAYQYGGSSYASSSIKLSIDLTGAITASPTGYNINKSYETVLRVTGRE